MECFLTSLRLFPRKGHSLFFGVKEGDGEFVGFAELTYILAIYKIYL